PGDKLPGWAFAIHRRTDHEPLWENQELIAREAAPGKASVADAQRFADNLCAQLGLPDKSAIPAYEDAGHFALVEQKLPINASPGENRLADPAHRARILLASEP